MLVTWDDEIAWVSVEEVVLPVFIIWVGVLWVAVGNCEDWDVTVTCVWVWLWTCCGWGWVWLWGWGWGWDWVWDCVWIGVEAGIWVCAWI